ncbi:16S rRNA (guanine(527)-N(7))-methyltransferase RsmG [Corynebacterium poyangense]|uniref:Ribosomal RNA small subunit methyltransferase G n=1 Tax=Corynebacterium poyangense TaxID=2684405 RepID=A0A7H0SS04_9CORY|nr:16S rRNA (guanine(527)-N(7))-methyltransferase RsmG [Corynebacterium poyangense]MBZ8177275.1 16S rRNA (guanine(527)-N(7))-methyltransferase RsmG [Corynebacterium poyangense]QNQ91329.1 16S rRNA (guanine(527)-N(7))-methyltransferase RsmG [Corynebacterium poyangense]
MRKVFHVKPEPLSDPELDPTPEVAREIFGTHLSVAVAYHRSLASDGAQRGFIGPREVPRLWERHILNCAVIAEAMPEKASVVDVGSGAGLPGIPLAIARPQLQITLIEPLLKRSTYLQEIVSELGLKNVSVIRGRAEDKAVRFKASGADIVTSRAVAPLGKLCGWSLPLVRRGGMMVAMKGSSVTEEIERDAKAIRNAGGGAPEVVQVGGKYLSQATTLVRIPRVR